MNPFATELQLFQFYDKYSRFDWEKGRRETWEETVNRAVDFLYELGGDRLDRLVYEDIKFNIFNLRTMPSMRLLAMAGPPARRTNICIYNCSFLGIDDLRAFDEILLISMNGCGVGFSVEDKFIKQLPPLPTSLKSTQDNFVIPDTTEGWQQAIRHLFEAFFYQGQIPLFDYSQIRPTGAPLKTKGGRASGPEIFKKTIDFIVSTLTKAWYDKQERLTPIQAHDIACSLGNAAVSGGIRRTAMISIFDLEDDSMLKAKQGDYNSFRWNANNSVVYNGSMTQEKFIKHMGYLFGGENGEPCIFSLKNAQELAPERRASHLIQGTNPCGEINLWSKQFCNLTAGVARENDTVESLKDKVKMATIMGTIQSLATYFPGLRSEWEENCKAERLLGVDITGQMDCPPLIYDDGHIREQLRDYSIEINREYAQKLGIVPSASITCVKPSGNSSQLLDCSSGMNPRWSRYYIRNVRVSTSSPVYKVLFASGVPLKPENGQTWDNMTTAVASFPVKAPDHALTNDDLTLDERLGYWKLNKLHYTEHNPSVTITYEPHEVIKLVNWIWDNMDIIGGLTFLPKKTDKYDNMPYEEISEEEYEILSSTFPKINWALLEEFEQEDMTTAAQEVACMSGLCEI
ncbi:recombinase [Candidatus Parcubacteria bacterium]|nr:MAG: recombinase [Candidatus Parcubacteria bacterium]